MGRCVLTNDKGTGLTMGKKQSKRLWKGSQMSKYLGLCCKWVGGNQPVERQCMACFLMLLKVGLTAGEHLSLQSHVTHLANIHWMPNKAAARTNCVIITMKTNKETNTLTNPFGSRSTF